MASSTEMIQVHVRIIDEAVDVWRPVNALVISEHVFRLSEDPAPEDEQWSFCPGDTVVVEGRTDADGRDVLIAVARAQDVDEPSNHWLKAG